MLNRQKALGLVVAFLVSSSSLIAAKVPADGSIAPIEISRSAIRWRVQVPGTDVTITVTRPDGEVVRKEFRTQNPSFSASDLGDPLEDGAYTFELTVTPSVPSHVKERLQNARKNNDEAEARRLLREAGLDRSFVESGAFSVSGGSFVVPELEGSAGAKSTPAAGSDSAGSPAASAGRSLRPTLTDQVIPDDLIVQGSACVGLDCVNNESFGFDTIRLKENNLRIAFDDTSVTSGFPFNDWQILANDSASGGASKLSVEDITGGRTPFTLRAGAPTNSIFVDSTGRVGLRTATPVLDLHITTGNTPAWRLEQNSTSGFTAQTWDVAGNEANFFVRDVTGGSRLPFRIRPGAPTSSIDIAASGHVGIATASPKRRLHVVGGGGPVAEFPEAHVGPNDTVVMENNGNMNLSLLSAASSFMTLRFLRSGASTLNGWMMYEHTTDSLTFGVAGAERVRINSAGSVGFGISPSFPIHHSSGAHLSAGGVWTNASSRELKEGISDLQAGEAIDALKHLTPVTYEYKNEEGERYAGFIAEDVPDLVASGDRKGLSPMDIVAVLTKVVQEQQKTIDELTSRLEKLEGNPK